MTAPMPMPPIIYGTAWKKARTADLVTEALKAGFRGIDTACQPRHYHEPGVGEALKRAKAFGVSRGDVFLQTKFTPEGGQDPTTIPYDPASPLAEQVATSFAVSQQNLGTQWVDSLVLHSPMADHDETMAVWQAMEGLVDAGHVGMLGISNCYDPRVFERLLKSAKHAPRVLQNRFYKDSGYDVALRALCIEQGIAYQSFWTLTANPTTVQSSLVRAIAHRGGHTPAQVFFAYVMALGVTPLTGTTQPSHMAQDLVAKDISLTPEQIDGISGLLGL